MTKRLYPKRCPECGGQVSPIAAPGRTMDYNDLSGFSLPTDLGIPTCEKCGEEYWDEGLINEVDQLLREQYEEEQRHRCRAALKRICKTFPKSRVEIALGVSQGYLSKQKVFGPQLMRTLLVIAEDPPRELPKFESLNQRGLPPWLADEMTNLDC